MKMNVKKILLWVLAVCSLVAVVWCGAWCSAQVDVSLCEEVQIVLHDSLCRQYVDADELEVYLKRADVYPLGKTMEAVDCHAIEQCLQGHDMLRKVECYKSPFGVVHIGVTQRVPVLYVVTNDGCYYVDSDRLVMPVRKQINVDVPVLKGAVSERAAREEYYDFVAWLDDDSYWGARVKSVHVSHPKHVVLHQEAPDAKIIIGALEGYEKKLAKLRKVYTKGAMLIDSIGYSAYDLRFEGQVVGKK